MSVSFKDGCLQISDDMQGVHGNYIGRQDIDANCMVVRDDGQNLDPTLDFDGDLGDDAPGDIGD